MATKQLFNTPEKLMKGYCDVRKTFHLDNDLQKGKAGRRVYLLGRPLNTGNVSLYRYSCHDGKRQRESLGVVLSIETSYDLKRANEEKLRLQVLACNALNDELERKDANFEPKPKGKKRLIDFINESTNDTNRVAKNLSAHLKQYDGEVYLRQVDVDWLRGFIKYLQFGAEDLRYRQASERLSQNTINGYLRKLKTILRVAVRQHLLACNPFDELEPGEMVAAKQGTRSYLTEEEVRQLIATPLESQFDVKSAFIFACFTGLRYSDLQQLIWPDFGHDANGRFLRITMQKTREPLKIYVPDVAFHFLPKRMNREQVFNISSNRFSNIVLQRWGKEAGITKHISFHAARHSAATMLLSAGVPIQVIQKQLGHLKASTTEIYAKLMDKAQVVASQTFDEMFKKI